MNFFIINSRIDFKILKGVSCPIWMNYLIIFVKNVQKEDESVRSNLIIQAIKFVIVVNYLKQFFLFKHL